MCIHWKFQPDPEGDFVIAPRTSDRLPPRGHFNRSPSLHHVATEIRSPKSSTYRSSDSTVLTVERKPPSSHQHKRSTSLRTPPRGAGHSRESSHSIPAPAPLLHIPDAKPAIPIPAGHKEEWIYPAPPTAPSPPSSTIVESDNESTDDTRTRVSSATSRSPPMSDFKANRRTSTTRRKRDDTPAPPKAPSSTVSNVGSSRGHSRKTSRDSRRSVVVENGSKRNEERLAIEGEDRNKRLSEERIYYGEGGRRRTQYHYR